MLKLITTGALAAGIALSSLGANATTTGTRQSLDTGSTCNQARQFQFFLRQMAISDGNTTGWPYADWMEPKECRAAKAGAAARVSLPATPAGNARVATANS